MFVFVKKYISLQNTDDWNHTNNHIIINYVKRIKLSISGMRVVHGTHGRSLVFKCGWIRHYKHIYRNFRKA